MVADMEVDKVADTVTDMVADKKQKIGRHGVRHGGRHGSTLHSHYIHTTFTLHLHIDGASSRSFERHFLISIAGEVYK